MSQNSSANREHKSSAFSALFSEPEKILTLYNAVSRNEYPLDASVKITTLENVFYNEVYNDLSFVIDDKLVVLAEAQSSINNNMPLRFLFYMSEIYSDCIDGRSIYRKRLIKIPHPEFIVLYNGKEEYPDESILKLSDAFCELPEGHKPNGSLELTVKVLNINKGHNKGIVQKSAELEGYVEIISEIRKNQDSGLNLKEAIDKAVKDCIDKGILPDFLKKYGGDVMSMLYKEWDSNEYGEVQREEGVLEGLFRVAKSMLKKGYKPEDVAECTELPLEQVRQLQPQ